MRSLPFNLWNEAIQKSEVDLKNEVLVITLVGKSLNNSKVAEEINEHLGYYIFPSNSSTRCPKFDADLYYSKSERIVYIMLNSPSDFSNEVLTDSRKSFFEKIEALERPFLHSLHVASLISHFIVFIEPTSRLDTGLVRTLKDVSKIQLASKEEVRDLFISNFDQFSEEDQNVRNNLKKSARLIRPTFLFGFKKSILRPKMLPHNLRHAIKNIGEAIEAQALTLFKNSNLIGNWMKALGNFKGKSFRLLYCIEKPSRLADFDFDDKEEEEEEEEEPPIQSCFLKLISKNAALLRKSYKKKDNKFLTLNTLRLVIQLLTEKLNEGSEVVKMVDQIVGRDRKFFNEQNDLLIEDTVEKYSYDRRRFKTEGDFSKGEHDQRVGFIFSTKMHGESLSNIFFQFTDEVSFLDGWAICPRDEAIGKLRAQCNNYEKNERKLCKQQSVTGTLCKILQHPVIGDESIPQYKWKMHENDVFFFSTCLCGTSQTRRNDPFTLKEANYDFYHNNPAFKCCNNLEKHHFQVWMDDSNRQESCEEDAIENWTQVGDNREVSMNRRSCKWIRMDSDDDSDKVIEISFNSTNSISFISSESESKQISSGSSTEVETIGSSRSGNATRWKEESMAEDKITLEAKSYLKVIKELEEQNISYTTGVPHSLAPGVLPVFPSWYLTCLGPSYFYKHSFGLRDHANFKIHGEFLLPIDFTLLVDKESWEDDKNFVNAVVEGNTKKCCQNITKKQKRNIEIQVKLFVGFDYECRKGHRFFINASGEPMHLPKFPQQRESVIRESAVGLLTSDLPLRRRCTCNKLPHQAAQLMKVHIVTPKAPVQITIDPKIFLPNQDGYFHTGEAPLKLDWAKYYILQLPRVYSGPQGLWIPPKSLEKVGVYKANSIQVSYTPLGAKTK